MLIRNDKDGIMIPIPQYPLYSAAITALGGAQVPYFLDEDADWGMSTAKLDEAANEAKANGVELRSLCIINPGNPTGQVMTEENIKEVIGWAAQEGVLIMADEVYQTNVYDPTMQFTSFKKALRAMEDDGDIPAGGVELVSFHSTSKGILGECGLRGGYLELTNIEPDTAEEVYKSLSVNLCSNLPGQVMVDLMVNQPKQGDPSYPAYRAEFDAIFESLQVTPQPPRRRSCCRSHAAHPTVLQRRATTLVEGLNKLEGVSCNASSGAMYAFPQIRSDCPAPHRTVASSVAPSVCVCVCVFWRGGCPSFDAGAEHRIFHFLRCISLIFFSH